MKSFISKLYNAYCLRLYIYILLENMKNQPQTYYLNNPQSKHQNDYNPNFYNIKQQPNNLGFYSKVPIYIKNKINPNETNGLLYAQKKANQTLQFKAHEIKSTDYNKNLYADLKLNYVIPRISIQKKNENRIPVSINNNFVKSSVELGDQNSVNGNQQNDKKKINKNQEQIQNYKNAISNLKKQNTEKNAIITQLKQRIANVEEVLNNIQIDSKNQNGKIENLVAENQKLKLEINITNTKQKKLVDQITSKKMEKQKLEQEKADLKANNQKVIEQLKIKFKIEKQAIQKNFTGFIQNITKDKNQTEKKCILYQKKLQESQSQKKIFKDAISKKQTEIHQLNQQILSLQKTVFNPEKQNFEMICKMQENDIIKLQTQINSLRQKFKKQQNKCIVNEEKILIKDSTIKTLQTQLNIIKNENQKLVSEWNKQKITYLNDKQSFIKKLQQYDEKFQKFRLDTTQKHHQTNQQKKDVHQHHKKRKCSHHEKLQELDKQKLLLNQEIKLLIEQKQILYKQKISNQETYNLKKQITKKTQVVNNLINDIKNMDKQIVKHRQNSQNFQKTQQMLKIANQKIISISLKQMNAKYAKYDK